MAKPKKRPRGRPPVPAEQQRRNKISVRVRDDLLEWVDRVRKATGKTRSEQCETFLQVAFERATKGEEYDVYMRERLEEAERENKRLSDSLKKLRNLVGRMLEEPS